MFAVILKQRIPTIEWKRCQLLNDCSFLSRYTFKPNNQLESYIYKQNITVVKSIISFQLNVKEPVFDTFAITSYISELNKIKNNNKLLERELNKLNSTLDILNRLSDEAFIGEYYIPQVTMDVTYNRLYFHPLFRIPEKVIKNLFVKFGLISNKQLAVAKVDINGALVRTVFSILYNITKDSKLKQINETIKADIYELIYDYYVNKSVAPVYNREQIKNSIIVLINGGTNKEIQNGMFDNSLLSLIKRYIIPNIDTVRKYMTVYSNKRLLNFIAGSKSMFFFTNLDGGILIFDKNETEQKIKVSENLPVSFELLVNWIM